MPQNQQTNKIGMRESFNLMYALCKVHAYCIWPLIRRDFGTDAMGFPAFFALLLMLLVATLARIPELFPYVGVWLLAVLWQRTRTMRLVKQGAVWHSRYEGTPWLALRLMRSDKDSTARRMVEPMLCLAAGIVLYQVSPGLGGFVMAGCASMGMLAGINSELDRKRLAAMRDAEIEQRWLAARYRGQVDE
jgi:hypothetical protein